MYVYVRQKFAITTTRLKAAVIGTIIAINLLQSRCARKAQHDRAIDLPCIQQPREVFSLGFPPLSTFYLLNTHRSMHCARIGPHQNDVKLQFRKINVAYVNYYKNRSVAHGHLQGSPPFHRIGGIFIRACARAPIIMHDPVCASLCIGVAHLTHQQ